MATAQASTKNSTTDAKRPGKRSDELVSAAAQLFQERGYEATSMQDIADAVGLLKGSVYHYIRTKEDLLWMIMEPGLSELVDGARATLTDKSIPVTDRLRLAMEAHARSFDENYPHMSVLTREDPESLSTERRGEFDALRNTYAELWRKAIVEGIKSGELRKDVDPRMSVLAILGMLNWMSRWFKREGKLSATRVADEFAALVIRGMQAP